MEANQLCVETKEITDTLNPFSSTHELLLLDLSLICINKRLSSGRYEEGLAMTRRVQRTREAIKNLVEVAAPFHFCKKGIIVLSSPKNRLL